MDFGYADSSDLYAIIELRKKTGVWNKDEDTYDILKKTISYDNQALLVGKEGSTIISSCMLIYHPFQTFIYRFSIDPKNHRQGIGSQMCSFIEKTLKDKGMLHPTLFTEIENKDANDFWSAMGRENLYQVNCFVKNLDS